MVAVRLPDNELGKIGLVNMLHYVIISVFEY